MLELSYENVEDGGGETEGKQKEFYCLLLRQPALMLETKFMCWLQQTPNLPCEEDCSKWRAIGKGLFCNITLTGLIGQVLRMWKPSVRFCITSRPRIWHWYKSGTLACWLTGGSAPQKLLPSANHRVRESLRLVKTSKIQPLTSCHHMN